MQYVTLRYIATNHSTQCSTPAPGATLLRALGIDRATLASITPLNNGEVYRRYRFVQPDGFYNLADYAEVYTPDRNILARIEPVQEVTYAHQ